MKWTRLSATALCAAANLAPAFAADPPKPMINTIPARPPSIFVYSSYEDNQTNLRGDIIRPVTSDWQSVSRIPASEYPADAVRERRSASAKIKVGVGGNDSIIYCTPVSHQKDAALAAGACDIIRKYSKFTHAVDKGGNAVDSEIFMVVGWDFMQSISAPPAPPGPTRWIGKTVSYRTDKWPPTSDVMTAEIQTAPDWQPFILKDKTVPKRAAVGLQIILDAENKPSCVVRESSGHSAMDKASCDALTSGTYQSRAEYRQYAPPTANFLVNWKKGKPILFSAGKNTLLPILKSPGKLSIADRVGRLDKLPSVPLIVLLNRQGVVERCTVIRGTGNDGLDAQSCRVVETRSVFTPAKDAFGRPTQSSMRVDVDWGTLTISTRRDFTYP